MRTKTKKSIWIGKATITFLIILNIFLRYNALEGHEAKYRKNLLGMS